MAVAFRSVGTIAMDHTATSLVVPYPAGVVSGDLLIIQALFSTAATPPAPSGWTLLFGPIAASGSNAWMWYRIAGASEPSTVTFTKTATHAGGAIMSAFSGADTTAPINASATTASSSSGVSPSVTTTVANTMLLRFYAVFGPATTNPPGTSTERYDVTESWQGYGMELGTSTQAAIGASGTTTATFGGSTFGGMAATVAVAPLAVPTTTVGRFKRLKLGTGISGTDLGGGVLRLDIGYLDYAALKAGVATYGDLLG